MKPQTKPDELASLETPQITIPGATILEKGLGLQMDPNCSFERWESVALFWGMLQKSCMFLVGDWLNQGQRFVKHGARFTDAVARTGYEYQTLRHAASVASQVDLCRRRHKLSFEHHKAVAPLTSENQTKWLDAAEAHGLNRNELRNSIEQDKIVRDADEAKTEGRAGLATIQGAMLFMIRWIGEVQEREPMEKWPINRCCDLLKEVEPAMEFFTKVKQRVEAARISQMPKL